MNPIVILAALAAVVTVFAAPETVAVLATALGFAVALMAPIAAVAGIVVAAGHVVTRLDARRANAN